MVCGLFYSGMKTSDCPGLTRKSAAVRLPGLRVRIPPGAWISVTCECCVLSGRGLCECGVSVSDRENSKMGGLGPRTAVAPQKKMKTRIAH